MEDDVSVFVDFVWIVEEQVRVVFCVVPVLSEEVVVDVELVLVECGSVFFQGVSSGFVVENDEFFFLG